MLPAVGKPFAIASAIGWTGGPGGINGFGGAAHTAEASNSAIFNLAGQQVKNTQKGIYIQNGKKFVVK